MTKEIEFLEKQGYIFDKDKYLLFMEEFFSSEHKIKDICDLLSKYADQETGRLKAELEAKDKEINKHLDISFALQSELNKINSKHVTEITMRNKRINDLEYKLSELKERHKLLNNILGSNTPFPLNEILKGLIESAHILLHKKDYDGHGWEHLEHCYKKAKDVNDLIEQYYKQKFEK